VADGSAFLDTSSYGLSINNIVWSNGVEDALETAFPEGTHYVEFVDQCLSPFAYSFEIESDDITAPTVTCSDVTFQIEEGTTSSLMDYDIGFFVSGTDNCSDDLTWEFFPATISADDVSGGIIEATAYDESGNSTTCDFTAYLDVILGVEEMEESIEVSTFPNPATDFITFQYDAFNASTMKLRVMNSMGQQVVLESIQGNLNLDLSSYAPGMYVFQLLDEQNEQRSQGRFIVQ
ncbi:MAG: T9SS type A sorting domain-containing protein, partial [Bacteroidota bacterium]